MRFYELPSEVENKIRDTDSRPFVRVVFELSGGDVYIPDSDILECVTTSYKTEAGGIVNCGELLLRGLYDFEHVLPKVNLDFFIKANKVV